MKNLTILSVFFCLLCLISCESETSTDLHSDSGKMVGEPAEATLGNSDELREDFQPDENLTAISHKNNQGNIGLLDEAISNSSKPANVSPKTNLRSQSKRQESQKEPGNPAFDYLKGLDQGEPTIRYVSAESGGEVRGRQGTVLTIPPGAFERKDGSPAVGQVMIVLDEFLNVSRSITNGLTTMAEGRRLETGGMLKIGAEDNVGEELQLAEDKVIEMRIPTRDLRMGMQTFTGRRSNGVMNWLPQEGMAPKNKFGFNTRDMISVYHSQFVRKASFPGGQEALSAFLSEFMEYPEDAANKGITGSCTLGFDVDEDGEVSNVKVLEYNFPSFSYEAVEVLRKMRFYPAFNIEGEFAAVKGMEMKFFFAPKTEENEGHQWDDLKSEYDLFVEDKVIQTAYYQEILTEIEAKMDSLASVRLGCGFGRSEKGIMYNVLSTQDLGWINCDRFLNENVQLANVSLDVEKPKNKAFFLVVKETRSIMPGDYICEGNRICFPNLPVGYSFKILGVEKVGDHPFLFEYEGEVCAEVKPIEARFIQVVDKDVRSALTHLNRFQGRAIVASSL